METPIKPAVIGIVLTMVLGSLAFSPGWADETSTPPGGLGSIMEERPHHGPSGDTKARREEHKAQPAAPVGVKKAVPPEKKRAVRSEKRGQPVGQKKAQGGQARQETQGSSKGQTKKR
ncbi:MAG: hypothetical protein HYZ73_03245 [Elusimicrobia bacterium]|nr:hypothetical protein [Elusimicrobiota bacterium]